MGADIGQFNLQKILENEHPKRCQRQGSRRDSPALGRSYKRPRRRDIGRAYRPLRPALKFHQPVDARLFGANSRRRGRCRARGGTRVAIREELRADKDTNGNTARLQYRVGRGAPPIPHRAFRVDAARPLPWSMPSTEQTSPLPTWSSTR